MSSYTIGQLARHADVNVETVRYYERRGLIPEPPRRASGYREYSQYDVARIQFIKRSQELGFSLKEIGELLSLRVAPQTTCADVKGQTERKIVDIEDKIQTLQRMKTALIQVAMVCTGAGPTSDCPILEFLDATEGGTRDEQHPKN
jgi:MerR family transcriptional regulator, copper efflux regulator